VLEAGRLVASRQLPPDGQSARWLAPAIRDLLEQAGWSAREIQLVAVTAGPGSFTGLRVGIATAKALAYAAGAEVLGVGTLDAIAARCPVTTASRLHVAIDAQRRQVFAAAYQPGDAGWEAAEPVHIVDQDRWLAGLEPGSLVTGPVLRKLAERVPPGVSIAPEACWPPAAETVGALAWCDYEAGRRDDLWQFVPRYHRPSAAEEKLGGES